MRSPIRLVFAVILFVLSFQPVLGQQVTPGEAFERLARGNERYTRNTLDVKEYERERSATASGQNPYAIVLACADSRVPPEILFDESIGRLFVVRVAGNVADPVVLGSIEYAAEHLHVPAILVLGHRSCGAVKATLEGGHVPENVAALAGHIEPAVKKLRTKKMDDAARVDAGVTENVLLQMDRLLSESTLLTEMAHKGEIEIRGAIYDLRSGKVAPVNYDPLTGKVASTK